MSIHRGDWVFHAPSADPEGFAPLMQVAGFAGDAAYCEWLDESDTTAGPSGTTHGEWFPVRELVKSEATT